MCPIDCFFICSLIVLAAGLVVAKLERKLDREQLEREAQEEYAELTR